MPQSPAALEPSFDIAPLALLVDDAALLLADPGPPAGFVPL